tara:strand:+ start:3882 stop:4784 length:903 start_codon:yes stop_codon:yes gene_type:complete
MRTNFINSLSNLAVKDKKIFLLCGDLGFSVLEEFIDQFPDRFLNLGVSEQNMSLVASGLAMEGYNVFVYSIGNFPTLRAMEQVRYDICYHNLNVTLVSVGGGYAYGSLGPSHHSTEDFAMLRSLPNMLLGAPADPVEANLITSFFAKRKGPGYIRLNKSGEPKIHKDLSIKELKPGEIIRVIKGEEKVAVLSNSAILGEALSQIKNKSLGYSLYSCPFIGLIDKGQLKKIFNHYERIITFEEHQRSGGFGSYILEEANDLFLDKEIKKFPVLERIAVPDVFQSVSGSQEFLRELSKLELN